MGTNAFLVVTRNTPLGSKNQHVLFMELLNRIGLKERRDKGGRQEGGKEKRRGWKREIEEEEVEKIKMRNGEER